MAENTCVTLTDPEGLPLTLALCRGILTTNFEPLNFNVENMEKVNVNKDDVIILAKSNCGTHWLWEIIMMLLRGKAETLTGIKENTFLEYASGEVINATPKPRVLNTHLYPRHFPESFLKSGIKTVLITRNPKDAFVSQYHLELQWQESDGYKGTFASYFDLMFSEHKYPMDNWFLFHKYWENYFNCNPYVKPLILYYEDMKEDLLREVKRIANYLDVKGDDDLFQQIADLCTFKSMKEAKVSQRPEESLMYRKGESGKWKNTFTVALDERMNELFDEFKQSSKIASKIRFTL